MSPTWKLVLAITVLAQPGARTVRADLLANPSFRDAAKGWELRNATTVDEPRHGEGPSVKLVNPDMRRGHDAHVAATIKPVPGGRELRFTCFARGERPGQSARIQAIGTAEGGRKTAHARRWATLKGVGWELVELIFAVPTDTAELRVEVAGLTPIPLYVADAHLSVGGAREAPLYELRGPGVLHAQAFAGVRPGVEGRPGVVTLPIPGTYRDQVPLSFRVRAVPSDSLRGYRWVRREDGLNWLLEATVVPPAAGALVGWEALVLVGERSEDPLPAAAKPEVPEEARPWTRPTACVQSDDPGIVATAEELSRGTDGVESYARKVMHFTSTHEGERGARFDSLDARKGLECGGSCTSRANLAAALLRARGIPARTVAHLPTWAGPLYEHWLVEYWHPKSGWVWLESSYETFAPQPWTLAVLNVASPEDEDRAFDRLQTRHVMPGAPRWSVHSASEELLSAFGLERDDTRNQATPERRLSGDPAEVADVFAAARVAFAQLADQGRAGRIDAGREATVRQALAAGKASDLARALRSLGGNG